MSPDIKSAVDGDLTLGSNDGESVKGGGIIEASATAGQTSASAGTESGASARMGSNLSVGANKGGANASARRGSMKAEAKTGSARFGRRSKIKRP